MKKLFSIVVVLALAACTPDKDVQEPVASDEAASASPAAVAAAGGNPGAETASKQITDEFMREIIIEISDDRYEGRGPGTRGDEMARTWLAEHMAGRVGRQL